jgi:hypothetical protein
MQFSSEPTDEDLTDNPLAGLTFDLDAETFRCEGKLDMLESSDLAAVALSTGPMAEAAEAASIAFAMRQALGDSEYQRYRSYVREHNTPPRVTMEIMAYINDHVRAQTEEATGRPTQSPARSSRGRTGQAARTSRIASLRQQGDVQLVVAPPPDMPHPEPLHPAPGQPVPEWDTPPGLAGKQPASVRVTHSGTAGAKRPARRSRAG